MLGTSAHEDRAAEWLDELGVAYVRQKAIGPYNVDFALTDLAIVLEINGGGHNPRVRANAPARRAFIERAGWSIVELVNKRGDVSRETVHQMIGAQSRVP